MGKYTLRKLLTPINSDDLENHSGYESDGGQIYYSKKTIGTGTYATARQFSSEDGSKEIAVLTPVVLKPVYIRDLTKKSRFFKAIYPENRVEIFYHDTLTGSNPRLVVPLLPGKTYAHLKIASEAEQLSIFISAISAIKKAHDAGYVIIDFSQDNILYDETNHKSYLIDGGLATLIGRKLPEQLCYSDMAHLGRVRKESPQVAPECWWEFEKEISVAEVTMDIYSLGNVLERIVFRKCALGPGLKTLLQECQHYQAIPHCNSVSLLKLKN